MRVARLPLALIAYASLATAQLSPEDALREFRVADGLALTLFAAEPQLYNPTCIDVDAKGRVWVAEAVNYRLFNQPATRDQGDRIRILEDTDGDGRCDTATTFYQDPSLQAPMGVAVLGDRVYVCQSPELFYLRDTNRDGVADEKTVVLTGFGGTDNDHGIHGVLFAPDGSLYMSNGDTGLDVTDKQGGRVHAGKNGQPLRAATVLRTDLEGNRLEWLAEGMRNPYEPAVDSFGNVFISDNDDDGNEQTRINYVMEGGYYGYHPRRRGDRRLDAVHWNEDLPGVIPKILKTGFGSPTGMAVYEGKLLPEFVRGAIIHADAGPGEIRAYRVTPGGAAFDCTPQVLLSAPGDKWFRPSDVAVAPDGSIFVADWYDPGVGGHRMGDTARGRIYRITPAGKTAYEVPALELSAEDRHVDVALMSPNQAMRYSGFVTGSYMVKHGSAELIEALWKSEDAVARARALWLLAESPRGAHFLDEAIHDADPRIRTQAARILARRGANALRGADRLFNDENTSVRRQLLLELRPFNAEPWAFERAVELAMSFDGQDRHFREAIGIALRGREAEAYAAVKKRAGRKWDARLAGLAVQLHPESAFADAKAALRDPKLATDLHILALDALDAIGSPESGREILTVASPQALPELAAHALHLLSRDEGGVWAEVMKEPDFRAALDALLARPQSQTVAWDFIVETAQPAFIEEMLARAEDTGAALAARIRSLRSVRTAIAGSAERPAAIIPRAAKLLHDQNPEFRAEAVDLLSRFRADEALQALRGLVSDATAPRGLRLHAAHNLSRSRAGALLLLNLAEEGTLPPDIALQVGEWTRQSSFDDVKTIAAQIIPAEFTREGQALPPFEELVKMAGDPERGRAVFFDENRSQCYQCHMINGQGRAVGPDLSAIGGKYGREGLLESILSPSAAIGHEYQVWIVRTRDDGYLSGFIRGESGDTIDLMDSSGAVSSISKRDVLERYLSGVSLMPTGLSAGMTAQELSDVVEFLRTLK